MASPDMDYIRETLVSVHQFHKLRDEMNGVLHLQEVRYSPLTLDLLKALQIVHRLCQED